MLDNSDYNYNSNPFTKTKKWGVHPLSQTGHQEYISNDSQVHWYMHKVSPKMLKQIYGDKQTSQVKDSIEEPQTEEIIKVIDESVELETEQKKPLAKEYGQTLSQLKRSPDILKTKTGFHPYLGCTKSTKFSCTNSLSSMKQSLAGTRYFNDYSDCELTKTQNNFQMSPGQGTKKFNTFKSYEVPRVEQGDKDDFKTTKLWTKSIANTVYNPLSNTTGDLTNENERLKRIFINQTSNDYINTNKLPTISNIVSQNMRLYNKTNTSNTKMMGSRYNPSNYIGQSKNWSKRNYLGALYPH
jgi:hypothetical protein